MNTLTNIETGPADLATPWKTIGEAAEYLRIERQTLINWRALGKGPKACGRRYHVEDLDRWQRLQGHAPRRRRVKRGPGRPRKIG